MQEIVDQHQFKNFAQHYPAAAIWFSGEGCNVCEVLLPRIKALLADEFPQVALARVDCAAARELAAAKGVFSIPTLLLYFDGREAKRFVRNFSPGQVREALARPYQLLFE